MKKMFQEVQNYQFEIARNDEEKASKPGFKVVDQEDIDRFVFALLNIKNYWIKEKFMLNVYKIVSISFHFVPNFSF